MYLLISLNNNLAMKPINLFLVDDHQIVLDGLSALFENSPETVVVGTAHSGESALDRLESLSADVVVLDVSMPPGIDGIETAKLIRRRFPNIKIILLTMVGEGHYIMNALRLGIHGYVMKEKSKETLMTAIRAVVNNARFYPSDLLNRIDFSTASTIEDEAVQLTKREKEILCLMVRRPGFSSRDLGEFLSISRTTVERHVQNIKDKLKIHKNTELVMYAMEHKVCE